MTSFLTFRTEQAFQRQAILGIELIDGVTSQRIYEGLQIKAVGLTGRPRLNASGLFYWLRTSPNQNVTAIEVKPGDRPYEPLLITDPIQLNSDTRPPILKLELMPKTDYPFPMGTTGWIGRLVERLDGSEKIAVLDAVTRIQILIDGAWVDSRLTSTTNARGEFAAIFRMPLAASNVDLTQIIYSFRLQITRGDVTRLTDPHDQRLGQIEWPTVDSPHVLAWDSLN